MDGNVQQLRLESMFEMGLSLVESEEYKLIKEFYSDRIAIRSKVPLINHINEGVGILYYLNSNIETMKAFALHPLVQSDKDLARNFQAMIANQNVSRLALALAMEYRNIANAYLSFREVKNIYDISLSPIPEVNEMLIADKIQNYKDFLKYHAKTHPRSKELDIYFNNWIDRLECRELFNKLNGKL